MKTEYKYFLTTSATGVIFLNSNTGAQPTITLDGSSKVPFTEEQKEQYSDDLEIYGPKIVLGTFTGETKTTTKKVVSKKASSKKATTKKVAKKASKKVTVSDKDKVTKEVETKLDASTVDKNEIKAKVRGLKNRYKEATDIQVRRDIKKEMETLLGSINA